MIEASESARRMLSALQRFNVPMEDVLAKMPADALSNKRTFAAALERFTTRIREETEGGLSDKDARFVALRLKQMDAVAEELAKEGAQERFEPAELALLASFLDLSVVLIATALGKEYRSPSPP
jgi:hypothetical protein